MSSALILSELDEDDGNTSNEIAAVDITSLTAVLKEEGLAVEIHTGVGRKQSGSISLHERTGKLVVSPNRAGILSIFPCCCPRHEFGPGELEHIPRRVYTRRLHRSISILSKGDPLVKASLLNQSLSILRRHPSPDSVDLTFYSVHDEERLRIWINEKLAVRDDLRANTRASRSSRHVIAALQGKSPSDVEDDRSLASTVRVGAEDDYEHERGGSGEQHERLLSGSGTKKKTSKSVRSSKKEKHKADQANRAAGEGADDEGSDIAAGRGEHGRGTDAAPPGAASARYYEETAMEGGAEKPRRRRVRKAV